MPLQKQAIVAKIYSEHNHHPTSSVTNSFSGSFSPRATSSPSFPPAIAQHSTMTALIIAPNDARDDFGSTQTMPTDTLTRTADNEDLIMHHLHTSRSTDVTAQLSALPHRPSCWRPHRSLPFLPTTDQDSCARARQPSVSSMPQPIQAPHTPPSALPSNNPWSPSNRTLSHHTLCSHTPSQFSYVDTAFDSLSRQPTSIDLHPTLSRPPSYKRYEDPLMEARLQHDMANLRRLEQMYRDEEECDTGCIDFLVSWPSLLSRKQVVGCVQHQFHGICLAFYVMSFVFVGTVSVFVPDLPPVAKLLWVPLALYVIAVIVYHWYRMRKSTRIHHLEMQVEVARRRRLHELLRNMTLPDDHYFVIEHNRPNHVHPVVTLLPPPPNYCPGQPVEPIAQPRPRHLLLAPADDWSSSPSDSSVPSPLTSLPNGDMHSAASVSATPFPNTLHPIQSNSVLDLVLERQWQRTQAQYTLGLEYPDPVHRSQSAPYPI
ncbi:hypothetical protein DM01DRAFT_1339350 [Hesseltinella vesiculosa]|uniref:Uncharacterized protein n=1 Tax=Hesseltinella vesiculosa TaxID=101127 RepID=A0A1X2G7I4_9FUNG|nr:hypothetical protein DM01DRAFT_1339350 [Hesseltinella vesiculosa]